mgnify:CR=1 FL=1
MSQSPQTGQFNSYIPPFEGDCENFYGLNPLKRVNSILTKIYNLVFLLLVCLNPLKRVNSILTVHIEPDDYPSNSLNPLKRVNSILT